MYSLDLQLNAVYVALHTYALQCGAQMHSPYIDSLDTVRLTGSGNRLAVMKNLASTEIGSGPVSSREREPDYPAPASRAPLRAAPW